MQQQDVLISTWQWKSLIEQFDCQECGEVSKSHDMLIKHVENIHVEKESKRRDYLFPQKCPNCPKWIYCDNENESHYDDYEEFGQCEVRRKNNAS